MSNLITEASKWLQDPICNTGSIQERTLGLLSRFKEYIKNNKNELEDDTGLSTKDIINEVTKCQTVFGAIICSYLKGVHYLAITSAKSFLKGFNASPMPIGARLYKARESESNYLFKKDELFHIPYNKRDKIGNQRFSVSGMPCLYLATSSYMCWEELGRVDFNSCNFCGFSNKKEVLVYDFSLPQKVNSLADVKRTCAILACSLAAKRDALFKEEYILPQCLLQALILRHHYFKSERKLFAVKYLSIHALNGDADCFKIDLNKTIWVDRLVNYVFPAASSDKNGHNQLLKELFIQTETISLFKETLLQPGKLISGNSDDVYLDSQFGLMDAYLDEKMGYNPLRKEANFLIV